MAKVVLFASSSVGREVLDYIWTAKRETLAGLVLSDSDSVIGESDRLTDIERAKIPVLRVSTVGEHDILPLLSGLEAEYFILAWWPHILSKELIRIPKIGAINFHPSLLPYNRGKNYNFWTIVEGTPFGVTLHFVDEGIDTGDIIFQAEIAKSWEDTGLTLYEKAQKAMLRLFVDRYDDILAGRYQRKRQEISKGNFHYASELVPASCIEIDGTYVARDFLNLLRAKTFPPYNGCTFIDETHTYEVTVNIRRIDNV